MKNKITNLIAVILAATILTSVLSVSALAVDTATLSAQNIYVDGVQTKIYAYIIKGSNYVKIADICKELNYAAFYVAMDGTVSIRTNMEYTEKSSVPNTAPPKTAVINPTSMKYFQIDFEDVEVPEAYILNGHNYIKIKDIAKALDFGCTYDGAAKAVRINSKAPYNEAETSGAAKPQSSATGTTASPSPSPDWKNTPITKISSWSREDFSQQANPAIFDGVYTRELYNAYRQSYIDMDIIIAGINKHGVNMDYQYAYFDASNGKTWSAANSLFETSLNYYFAFKRVPLLRTGYSLEVPIKEIPNDDYISAATVVIGDSQRVSVNGVGTMDKSNVAVTDFIKEVKALKSDTEKVRVMSNYVCDRIYYNFNGDSVEFPLEVGGGFALSTPSNPVGGVCTQYSQALNYLCSLAGIPCIYDSGDPRVSNTTLKGHAWNHVYVDGKWKIVDLTTFDGLRVDIPSPVDTRGTDQILRNYTPDDPKLIIFTKELLVPGSTK